MIDRGCIPGYGVHPFLGFTRQMRNYSLEIVYLFGNKYVTE